MHKADKVGIFLVGLAIYLLIRFTGCCKRRRRFDKRQPIPSFVDVRDTSSSFHDGTMYQDDVPEISTMPTTGDIEKGENGYRTMRSLGLAEGDRYPSFTAEAGSSRIGEKGWDTSHTPPMAVGIASTNPRSSPRTSQTEYEKQFFPAMSPTPALPPQQPNASRNLINLHRTSGSSTSSTSIASVYHYNGPPASAPFVPPQIPSNNDSNNGSATNPFFPGGRTGLTLANPDVNQPSLDSRRNSGTTAATSSIPFPTHIPIRPPTQPLHIQYQGFQPRAYRNSTSTISSFNSSTSSESAYSHMTRAVIPALYTYDAPMPAFMGKSRFGIGNGLGERDRAGSLDVPKDAVSRPGSEASTTKNRGRA